MRPYFLEQVVVPDEVVSHFIIRVQEYYRINQHDYFVFYDDAVLVRTQLL